MTPSEFAFPKRDRGENSVAGFSREHNAAPPPATVAPVPRFAEDVDALAHLTSMVKPPRVLVRPKSLASTALMFGDASGPGFGSSFWIQGAETLDAEDGIWTQEYSTRSSNFKEFYNLVTRIESLSSEGRIDPGTELFVFTDNSTTEADFYKGTSKSKLLFDLVLRLRRLEMVGKLFIHVIWVAGIRMISQGTDGLSRGDLTSGVLAGMNMLDFVPLNQTVEERHPGFASFWMESMNDTFPACHLDPPGWFNEAFKPGNYVWTPPPAAALEAVDQMCESRQIRPDGAHLFACPALMTNRSSKKLGRVVDVVFAVPVNTEVWGNDQHEPVIIALILPSL
ncbi:hypothetical protein ACA910_018466 [Epithemia clementina (nom. ined.)]